MRDDAWLQNRFDLIWQLFFPDVEKKNVYVCWKGQWKNKFGHIKKGKKGMTEIAINKLFKDLRVPEDMIKLTLAHEIVHYSHGFHSHLPQLFTHPHQGGIVDKELKKRGFQYAMKKEKIWYKQEWLPLFAELHPEKVVAHQKKSQVMRRRQSRGLFRWL